MNDTIRELEDLEMQLSFANDLLQIFLAFADEEYPVPGENEQVKALFYARRSKTYTTTITVAAEKLISAIKTINHIVESRGK